MRHWTQLLVYDIQELHDSEMRLLDVWPKMAEKAANPWLAEALQRQADTTERQIARLEQIAQLLAFAPDEVSCKGMKGLITEADNLLRAEGNPDVLDAALVGASRKFGHYGLAAYYSARLLALRLDLQAVVKLLELSLAELIASQDDLAAAVEGRHLPESSYGAARG